LAEIVAVLTPLYGADCPAAVVVRATWPDEQVLRAPLDQILGRVAGLGVERTALVLVGRALGAEGFRDSALYDAAHSRRFRGGHQP
jgi:precorrin-4/cobalt-precorrin-4 C11-methyltransferase